MQLLQVGDKVRLTEKFLGFAPSYRPYRGNIGTVVARLNTRVVKVSWEIGPNQGTGILDSGVHVSNLELVEKEPIKSHMPEWF